MEPPQGAPSNGCFSHFPRSDGQNIGGCAGFARPRAQLIGGSNRFPLEKWTQRPRTVAQAPERHGYLLVSLSQALSTKPNSVTFSRGRKSKWRLWFRFLAKSSRVHAELLGDLAPGDAQESGGAFVIRSLGHGSAGALARGQWLSNSRENSRVCLCVCVCACVYIYIYNYRCRQHMCSV